MKDRILELIFGVILIISLIGLVYSFVSVNTDEPKNVKESSEYHQIQSYNDVKKQAAMNYFNEYQNSDDRQREIIEIVVSSEFDNFDVNELDDDELEIFINKCKK